jgi:ABC-type Fe3+-siderophore transport system permease subunit
LRAPFTLGISAGASFGASLALAFGVVLIPGAVDYVIPVNAFVMAMLTAFLIHLMSLSRGVTAAIATAFVGTIGFIGLVGPHVARMLLGEDQRFFLSGSALCGALIHSIGSVLSSIIIRGTIIPIGIVTSLVGIPFFLFLVLGRTRASW